MKKLTFLLVACLFTSLVAADDYTSSIETFKKSPQVNAFFSDAYGYAVFPTIGKGGIGIGGAYGTGQVYKQGKKTGTTSMIQATIGFQLGGQAFSEIIFLQDERAYKKFTSEGFEFGAQASAVAITVGVQAQAGTSGVAAGAGRGKQHGTYTNGIATFTYAKGGLMYEAAVGGQKFSFDADK